MLAGRALFSQDTANDELVALIDRTRLCVWHTASGAPAEAPDPALARSAVHFFDAPCCRADEELEPVLANEEAGATEQEVEDAKHLVRWCLKGDPAERPTVAQIMAHRFLHPSAPPPHALPMCYHAFLSHAQADSSGLVGTLYYAYLQLGIHVWLDMREAKLTLEGMREGVLASDVFLLVLSESVLGSWFCRQEMRCAIEVCAPCAVISTPHISCLDPRSLHSSCRVCFLSQHRRALLSATSGELPCCLRAPVAGGQEGAAADRGGAALQPV